ncbi:UvrABC system protein A [Polystyrenella longa]|uniref:UvrABC system protein A n=1 Tax=Polystyrenella longa TaxID=2528007 RepID=A0A518CPV0_9PLAN|nr:excinuclease ABC subunit A [Polystyrenella longa]QDU81251.1 UvrABC system protein A [Polystyrenella longa]
MSTTPSTPLPATDQAVCVRGLRVHNLKDLDVYIPLQQFVVVIGVSGSGKSSLAHHTLYVEGQRRFNETLSPQIRQLLGTFQKPDADEISQLPPTITLRELSPAEQKRATVGSLTEIDESLALLFARQGNVVCPKCEIRIKPASPDSILQSISNWPEKTRYQIAFCSGESADVWQEAGFIRTVPLSVMGDGLEGTLVIVDRLSVGGSDDSRVLESLETAFANGDGELFCLREPAEGSNQTLEIEGRNWEAIPFSMHFQCPGCGVRLQAPHPQLFNPYSAFGKCDDCSGMGSLWRFSMEKLIPDDKLTIADGAIALTVEKGGSRLIARIEKIATQADLPAVLPIHAWDPEERKQFETLLDEYLTLELKSRARFKSDRFRAAWMTESICPVCRGTGMTAAALAVRLLDENYLQWQQQSIETIQKRLVELEKVVQNPLQIVVREVSNRLRYLLELGLEELALNRQCATLSTGERKLVQVAGLLSVGLVNTLYIIDEPSRGLHPQDQQRLIPLLRELLQEGNSLLVVDHAESFWQEADHLIELGPGPGNQGGDILFQGPYEELTQQETPSGNHVSTSDSTLSQVKKNLGERDTLRLTGVGTNNLKQLDVEFPLNALTVVSGISGSGKSSLVEQTLYPAVAVKLGTPIATLPQFALGHIEGTGELEQVVWVDPHRKPKNARSVVATALKIFSLIRQQFSETVLARTRNLTPGFFSFNTQDSGRCEECEGKGMLEVDMAFMEDLTLICPQCEGKRFRPDLLEVRFRGLNLDEVLNLSASEAFEFFRKLPQIQKRLQVLMELGIGYLELGRSLSSLSLGEQQRLYLAELLLQGSGARTLFLLDEPTSGLHPADIEPLLEYFNRMLEVGHTLVVIDNHPQLLKQAEQLIELGPGRGTKGGYLL